MFFSAALVVLVLRVATQQLGDMPLSFADAFCLDRQNIERLLETREACVQQFLSATRGRRRRFERIEDLREASFDLVRESDAPFPRRGDSPHEDNSDHAGDAEDNRAKLCWYHDAFRATTQSQPEACSSNVSTLM